jgi:hypothetical protein
MTIDLGITAGPRGRKGKRKAVSLAAKATSSTADLVTEHLQEPRAGRAVDDLMIARQRETDGIDEADRGLSHDGSQLDGVHAENRHLRWVDDGCEGLDPDSTEVADGERGSVEVIARTGSGRGTGGLLFHAAGQLPDRERVRVPDYRCDQALRRIDGERDVDLGVRDETPIDELGIQLRPVDKRANRAERDEIVDRDVGAIQACLESSPAREAPSRRPNCASCERSSRAIRASGARLLLASSLPALRQAQVT